jgi:ubiquitin
MIDKPTKEYPKIKVERCKQIVQVLKKNDDNKIEITSEKI